MEVSEDRRKRSENYGRISENRWQRRFPDAKPASDYDNIHRHIDFWHGEHGVDVKGRKLPYQIWLEFKNVLGENGWMKGDAKWISIDFPQITGFVLFQREECLEWCRSMFRDKNFEYARNSRDAYKKLYSRSEWGRDDLMTCVTIHDLLELNSFTYVGWSEEDIMQAGGNKTSMQYTHPQTGREMIFRTY